jgi:hypothetical protein
MMNIRSGVLAASCDAWWTASAMPTSSAKAWGHWGKELVVNLLGELAKLRTH